MCTVTYIPAKDKVFITSNRDEHVSRRAILVPTEVVSEGKKIAYPKDKTAGGTWFAVNEQGMAVVLLNGAFTNHDRTPPYRKSRGAIVLELIAAPDLLESVQKIDLTNIEPFTLVMFNGTDLWEFRWDGTQKHFDKKDRSKYHIWSSWTLYGKEAQAQRNTLFKNFIGSEGGYGSDTILEFHQNNHGDFENGFIVDRNNGLQTLSITQAILEKEAITLDHLDLSTEQKASVVLTPVPPLQTVS